MIHSLCSHLKLAPPDPPSGFQVERVISSSSLLLRWMPPPTDIYGRSNGVTVKGYTILCDGVMKMEGLQPLETKVSEDGNVKEFMYISIRHWQPLTGTSGRGV